MELKVKIKHLSAYKNDGVYIIDQIKGLRYLCESACST